MSPRRTLTVRANYDNFFDTIRKTGDWPTARRRPQEVVHSADWGGDKEGKLSGVAGDRLTHIESLVQQMGEPRT